MRDSFTEITRLEPLDIFYVGERHKTFFKYPAHCHEEYELNFVENGAGVVRSIGDSRETIGFSCGFNTLSHFNRLFRESKGCTPSEFRERF